MGENAKYVSVGMKVLVSAALASIQLFGSIGANAQDQATHNFSSFQNAVEIHKPEISIPAHGVIRTTEHSTAQITRPMWSTPEGTWSTNGHGMPCMISNNSKTMSPRGVTCPGNTH
jgi:hypothetical protein